MIEQFIEQTNKLLLKSDIKLPSLRMQEVEIEDSGVLIIYARTLSTNQAPARIWNNYLLHTMILFTLADAIIDLKQPELEGENFHRRYTFFKPLNDNQKIFKENYRILKLIRNAATHSKSGFKVRDNVLKIDYSYSGRQFKLEITDYGLKVIYSLLLNSYVPDKYPLQYKKEISNRLYNELYDNIYTLSDYHGRLMEKFPCSYDFNKEKYLIKNVKFKHANGKIKIIDKTNKTRISENDEVIFLINYQGKEVFLPRNILSKSMTINNSELPKWFLEN